jgi:predicted flap endonuclease-1-like 5' DNA nuclease
VSVYFKLVLSSICRSNHHRLAILALEQMKGHDARRWCDLFLHHHAAYLEGAKAPDEVFKDFKNHVLHVRDGDWGGAPAAAREWYRRTVRALKQQDRKHAAYCAGVMSHYVVDPVQPFHTAQTEEENTIHRAVEFSFSQAFPELERILRQDLGFPDLSAPDGEAWLEQMVRDGARVANRHYETVIDHYDFEVGVERPKDGLDQELKDVVAALMGYAAVSLARVLDRAFADAGVKAPTVNLTLDALFAVIKAPLRTILAGVADTRERAYIEAQYEEFRLTGKVRETLSEDDRVVRALHAEEVLKQPLSSLDCLWPRETGTAHGEGAPARKTRKRRGAARPGTDTGTDARVDAMVAPDEEQEPTSAASAAPKASSAVRKPAPQSQPVRDEVDAPAPHRSEAAKPEDTKEAADADAAHRPRIRLQRQDAVADAPSIGLKTANRLEALGVRTVSDLLSLAPEDAARRIKASHINAKVIRHWQAQALLACSIPDMNGTQAQLLVGAGVQSVGDLAESDADFLLEGSVSCLARNCDPCGSQRAAGYARHP